MQILGCYSGVHESGKSNYEGFYVTMIWLHAHHLGMLALNATPIADFGYLKDLPELLHHIVHGGVSTKTPSKKACLATKGGGFVDGQGWGHGCFGCHMPCTRVKQENSTCVGSTEERIMASLEHDQGLMAAAMVTRRARRAEATARVVEMYSNDPTYQFLHGQPLHGLIVEDMRKLTDDKVQEFSLATKWCP